MDNKTKELYEGWNLVGFGKDMTTQEIVNIYKDYDRILLPAEITKQGAYNARFTHRGYKIHTRNYS